RGRGLECSIRCARRRNVDDGCVRVRRSHRLLDRVEHRRAFVLAAASTGRHASDDLRSILDRLTGMERARLARDPLDEETGALVDENTHAFASSTTFRAA